MSISRMNRGVHRRQSYSRKTRCCGLRPISLSCRISQGRLNRTLLKEVHQFFHRLGIAFVDKHQHKHDEANDNPDRDHREVGLSFLLFLPLRLTFSRVDRS